MFWISKNKGILYWPYVPKPDCSGYRPFFAVAAMSSSGSLICS